MMLARVKVKIELTFTPAGSKSMTSVTFTPASVKTKALAPLYRHEKRLKSHMCYKNIVALQCNSSALLYFFLVSQKIYMSKGNLKFFCTPYALFLAGPLGHNFLSTFAS